MRISKFISYGRFLGQLPFYLKNKISFDQAKKIIKNRLSNRNDNFLKLARFAIYQNKTSPYKNLLKFAGCEYADLENGVIRNGLEQTLLQLQEAGVWLSLDEFKGRKSIQRGNYEFHIKPNRFDNPYQKQGIIVSSGGTTGHSVKSRFDLDFMSARTCYDLVMFNMLDLNNVPLSIWYPVLPASTGIGSTLRYAKAGHIPDRWFNMLTIDRHRLSLETRLRTKGIILLCRLLGYPLPFPETLPLDQAWRIASQLVSSLKEKGRCAFQSYVSQALRVTNSAHELCSDLNGLITIVGSEPLTPNKRNEIEKTGATVYHRYMATEIGTIAMGCGNRSEVDELHLMSDMIALIQPKEIALNKPGPLFFTSLNPVMPKVLFNVRLGDIAKVFSRECGCDFEKLGFHTHLSMVRSDEQFTCQGMGIPYVTLERAVADLLIPCYGGTSIDYQWVERETARGQTVLQLRVSPKLGDFDTQAVVNDVLSMLEKGIEMERVMSDYFRQSGVISVVREFPTTTGRGKILPFFKLEN
jgi:phenylacetate-coenzyme A ligase PaaK-like adenylate-forming protein